jgi:DNA-binding transcriptional MerR regulator
MDKSPDAFRTISEVAEVLDTPAHVLRFWESRFPQIRPVKRAGGRRYYRPSDVALLTGIKRLLHDEGLTIRGVQKILRDQGVRHVAHLSDAETSAVELAEPLADAVIGAAGDADLAANAAPADASVGDGPSTQPPVSARTAPVQPSLPLFDAAPKGRQLREDVTIAALARALPRGALPPASRGEVAALAQRLASLRATLAGRAEGVLR